MNQSQHFIIAYILIMITHEIFLKKYLLTESEYEISTEVLGPNLLSPAAFIFFILKIGASVIGFLIALRLFA